MDQLEEAKQHIQATVQAIDQDRHNIHKLIENLNGLPHN